MIFRRVQEAIDRQIDGLAERLAGLGRRPAGAAERQRVRSIRVLPRVLGLTYSRPRNSATPGSYERRSAA